MIEYWQSDVMQIKNKETKQQQIKQEELHGVQGFSRKYFGNIDLIALTGSIVLALIKILEIFTHKHKQRGFH